MADTSPTFRTAQIVYFTDLTRRDARVIPLGALAEVMLPHIHGLGLRARTTLTEDELNLVSPLIRDRLSNPFTFFRAEFDLAWDDAEIGHAIDFLAGRHATSLSIMAPVDYSQRQWLLERKVAPRPDAVDAQISTAIDTEFERLMKQYGDPQVPDRKLIESLRAA
jgi:hypothetical protein